MIPTPTGPSFRCGMCDRPLRRKYALIDRERKLAGIYGSATCAHDDAVGPRFRPYSVRKATAQDVTEWFREG